MLLACAALACSRETPPSVPPHGQRSRGERYPVVGKSEAATLKRPPADASSSETASADAASKVEGQEWPQIAKGVWQMTSLVSVGARKPKKSTETAHACTDPSWLFAGYWGPGIVERVGCQFSSWHTSANQYRIESACRVRRVGVARLAGTVVVGSPDSFQMEAELVEGTKHIRIAQTGRRISDCVE